LEIVMESQQQMTRAVGDLAAEMTSMAVWRKVCDYMTRAGGRVAISQSVSCQFIFAVQTVSLEVVNWPNWLPRHFLESRTETKLTAKTAILVLH
jgi:hypothetical protein